MKKVLVVGLGEVGRPLFEMLQESGLFHLSAVDLIIGLNINFVPAGPVDVMHLCFPCTSKAGFVDAAIRYIENYRPSLVIVNSSVVPGTTQEIAEGCRRVGVVYSPVRGMPKNDMKKELRRWQKYVAGFSPEGANQACIHFDQIGIKTRIMKDVLALEFAKLFETTYRACMIACFQEMHRMCRSLLVNVDEAIDMIADVDAVDHNKPVHYPGEIGGHCLMPNIDLLLQSYDSELLRWVKKSNELRKTEVKNPAVASEIEQVRKSRCYL
jgi:UDP-N-acetyl-D-mannosaminuronate dehydrogenase